MNDLEKLKIKKILIEMNVDELKTARTHTLETIANLEAELKLIDEKIDCDIARIDGINKYLNDLSKAGKEYDCFKVIELKLQGKSNVAIAEELGMHKNTVANKLKFIEEIIKNY